MENVIHSSQAVRVDSGAFCIRVTHVPEVRGGGYVTQKSAVLDYFTTVTQEVLQKTRRFTVFPENYIRFVESLH